MNPADRTGLRRDLIASGVAVALVATAVVVGTGIEERDGTLEVDWPPLSAEWLPHLGPGTPAALAVAVLAIGYGPTLAARLRWRTLLLSGWVASMAWIWSLALVDGWYRGVEKQLNQKNDYLRVVDRFDDIPAALRTFVDHIPLHSPDNWPAHIAGHPPAATLTFVFLDRIGLGGGGWAAAWCVTIGATAVIAVLIALRALADETLARKAAPFLTLAPAAVWFGVSGDAYFAAVAAWTVALLALAATRTTRFPAAAAGSGLLFGLLVYLSYGLTLFAAVVAAVLIVARAWRPLPYFFAGALVVPLAFTLAGFNWWEAYQVLVVRYNEGAGGTRPYSYWVWGNLACTALVVGAAGVAGIRRLLGAAPSAIRGALTARTSETDRFVALLLSVLAAVAVADLSGMSKAETERIWLPFTFFLLAAAALLPERGRRWWLTAQAVLALSVNHLLVTSW